MTPKQLLRRVFPPMLATLAGDPPPDEGNWAYELKYDGFRALVAFAAGELAMWSRNQLDLAPRFPAVVQALSRLRLGEAVLDGEIVALDEEGVPRFQLLQGGSNREKIFVFDVLWADGTDLRGRPYEERRARLEKLLRRPPPGVELARRLEGSGAAALGKAALEGWEGIIAKRRSSIYEPRRSKEWLKIKALNQQEFAIIGYNLSTASTREIGALHLGYYGGDGLLHYAGKVGTGFTSKLRLSLRETLARDEVPASPAVDAPRVRDARWVRPRLVGQVSFTEWTGDNRLRHPSFLGLRDDKSPEDVVREKVVREQGVVAARTGRRSAPGKNVAGSSKSSKASKATPALQPRVKLTNPDRVLYPRDGLTKADLAAYYTAVAAPLIRCLEDRPLSLEHWNQGITKPSWFHQNLGKEAPPWLHSIETPTRTTKRMLRHLAVSGIDELLWLAQMSVLTVHMWHSRGRTLESPDWIVFDLDPAKGKGIEQAIEAAIVMRGLLEHLELPSFPKTSGKRGIHVFVPLARGQSYEEASQFACDLAAAVTSKVPGMTVERSLSRRRGRLYLDCMQNAYGKTIVAPYSPRAIEGAPVSAPLEWKEVNKRLDPLKFTLRTMPDRLAKVGDLFAPVLVNGVRLPRLR